MSVRICNPMFSVINLLSMNLAQRLKQARVHAGLTQKEVATRAGIEQPIISRLESGRAKGSTYIAKIAFVCGVDPMWLMEGMGEMLEFSKTSPLIPAPSDTMSGKWPMLTWKMVGGIMEVAELKRLVPTEWVPGPPRPDGGFCLIVQSDEMTSPYPGEKSYPIGSRLYIDPGKEAINGSRVIVQLPGSDEAEFKILVLSGGRRYLKAANPQIPTYEMEPGMIIVGVVIGTYIPE